MLKRILWAWEDWKARRRGERRVAPYGATGRIYERIVEKESGPTRSIKVKTEGIVSISARKFNAATGQWEDLGEIARGTITEIK